MRTWHRSAFAYTCGLCGTRYPAGTALCRVHLPELKHDKNRCANCAGEPVPATLADGLPVPVVATHIDDDGLERPGPAPTMTPIRQLVALSDWKQKASGQ